MPATGLRTGDSTVNKVLSLRILKTRLFGSFKKFQGHLCAGCGVSQGESNRACPQAVDR